MATKKLNDFFHGHTTNGKHEFFASSTAQALREVSKFVRLSVPFEVDLIRTPEPAKTKAQQKAIVDSVRSDTPEAVYSWLDYRIEKLPRGVSL